LSTPSVSNGTLSNATVPASSFSGGTATILKTASSPVSYTFTAPPQSPTTVALRAIENVGSNAVSSSGHAEGSVLIRSGRIKVSNAFGSEKSSLSIPVQAQYWNGRTWVLSNSDTGCTSIPATAVALSNYKDHRGASTSTWLTTASSVTISGGNGTLTLSQPSLTGSATASDRPVGSVNLAFNLGDTSSTSDNACANTIHPATNGANLSWLRARWGSCAGTDTDPAARATFGVFSPETNKLIHVRELH
jgi:MSHA biogenesis protein MshQ